MVKNNKKQRRCYCGVDIAGVAADTAAGDEEEDQVGDRVVQGSRKDCGSHSFYAAYACLG